MCMVGFQSSASNINLTPALSSAQASHEQHHPQTRQHSSLTHCLHPHPDKLSRSLLIFSDCREEYNDCNYLFNDFNLSLQPFRNLWFHEMYEPFNIKHCNCNLLAAAPLQQNCAKLLTSKVILKDQQNMRYYWRILVLNGNVKQWTSYWKLFLLKYFIFDQKTIYLWIG